MSTLDIFQDNESPVEYDMDSTDLILKIPQNTV